MKDYTVTTQLRFFLKIKSKVRVKSRLLIQVDVICVKKWIYVPSDNMYVCIDKKIWWINLYTVIYHHTMPINALSCSTKHNPISCNNCSLEEMCVFARCLPSQREKFRAEIYFLRFATLLIRILKVSTTIDRAICSRSRGTYALLSTNELQKNSITSWTFNKETWLEFYVGTFRESLLQ